jgi:NAD+ synthase (glutamine-hydrolysing)
MKIALGQINTTIGDFAGNQARILEVYRRGVEAGAELVLVPELAVCGYPPRDLLLRSRFIEANWATVQRLAAATGRTGLVVGYAAYNPHRTGRPFVNATALLRHGQVQAVRTKTLLPSYDVFDEDRYFEPATRNDPVDFDGQRLGLTICEDIWNEESVWGQPRYPRNPPAELVAAGATLLVNISASPWYLGKNRVRQQLLANLAAKSRCPVVYCNLVGGNDELVFDGGSLAFDAQGRVLAQGALFAEDFLLVDTAAAAAAEPVPGQPWPNEQKVFQALVLGLRDYVRKCGFSSVLLGLSGGIDSALTAVIAAEALGPQQVLGVSLPSQFSSPGSLRDAQALARNLGIRYEVISIQPMFEVVKAQLAKVFAGRPEDVTEENIQARLRGLTLMALSNKFGALLLTTGNKSEMAVGYCTLYGDMCGGLAVIADVPKTMVYRIARWVNRDREIIPEASLTKPPSAELRPNQTDQDSLPPYETLDGILEAYLIENQSPEQMLRLGFDERTVRQVIQLIVTSEFKRRQAAPGLKVTSKAFGMGRRIPIAHRFTET